MISSTRRNCSCAVRPITSSARSWSVTPGNCTWIVSPCRAMSGSATPRASTRSRITSTVWSSFASSTSPWPGAGMRMVLTPPCRSRPSWGCQPSTRMVPHMAPTTTKNATNATVRLLLLMSRDLPLRCLSFEQVLLEHGYVVDGDLEGAVQGACGAAAHHHPLEEDLEVLEHLADLRVDRKLEGDRAVLRVDPEKARLHGVVHAVVDVHLDRRVLAHPAAVDVRLVREDDRRTHLGDRVAVLLLVVADGAHDKGDVAPRHVELTQ